MIEIGRVVVVTGVEGFATCVATVTVTVGAVAVIVFATVLVMFLAAKDVTVITDG